MQAALQLLGNEHAGAKVGADARRFQFRSQRRCRNASIKTRHQSDPLVRQRRNYPPQVVGLDPNIAVIHEEMLVAGGLRHVLEIAHLHVRPKHMGTDEQTDRAVRKLLLQLLDTGHSGIGWITDAENNLELGIVLQTVAAEALVNFRICALQRFEN